MVRVTMDKARQSAGVFFPDMALAHEHCQGKGAELNAAAHNPFHLDSINVFVGQDALAYQERQLQACGAYAEIDAYGLETFPALIPYHPAPADRGNRPGTDSRRG